jgi:hypothetical protein
METEILVLIITTVCSFLLQINSTIRQKHFHCSCSKCCEVDYDIENQAVKT